VQRDGWPHVICECPDAQCGLRYAAGEHERAALRCPACGAPVTVVHHLPARSETPPPVKEAATAAAPLGGMGMGVLLDNVRSVFNVGSIFRSADGAGFTEVYLCGVTPTPANPKLGKTALGAERAVHWTGHPNAFTLAQRLAAAGRTLWALEECEGAESLLTAPPPPGGLVLVVGSEVTGVDPDLLRICARTFAIPMRGSKRSLNVATAFGVAAVLLSNHPGLTSP
jgi:23S rRNA (guanosine2251-2'-O)-methyltransferase